jgi:hypothetical protein
MNSQVACLRGFRGEGAVAQVEAAGEVDPVGEPRVVGDHDRRPVEGAQYYLLAQDVYRLDRLHWVMKTSMLKTLAAKHSTTVTKMAGKYKTRVATDDGPRVCFQVTVPRQGRKPLVARHGGIPLKRQPTPRSSTTRKPPQATTQGNELIHRLLAERCELCESRTGLHVHHVRKLADLNKPGRPERPMWIHLMARRKCKTLYRCGCRKLDRTFDLALRVRSRSIPAIYLNAFRKRASELEHVHPRTVPVVETPSNAQVRSSDEFSAPTAFADQSLIARFRSTDQVPQHFPSMTFETESK